MCLCALFVHNSLIRLLYSQLEAAFDEIYDKFVNPGFEEEHQRMRAWEAANAVVQRLKRTLAAKTGEDSSSAGAMAPTTPRLIAGEGFESLRNELKIASKKADDLTNPEAPQLVDQSGLWNSRDSWTSGMTLGVPTVATCLRCMGAFSLPGSGEEHIIYCDHCDAEFHLACACPPLREIPEGDWFCGHCVEKPPSSDEEEDSDQNVDQNETHEVIEASTQNSSKPSDVAVWHQAQAANDASICHPAFFTPPGQPELRRVAPELSCSPLHSFLQKPAVPHAVAIGVFEDAALSPVLAGYVRLGLLFLKVQNNVLFALFQCAEFVNLQLWHSNSGTTLLGSLILFVSHINGLTFWPMQRLAEGWSVLWH